MADVCGDQETEQRYLPMGRGVCEECARRPAKYYLIHPISGEPVRVCDICERNLVKQITGRQNVVGPVRVDLGSTTEPAGPRRRYRVASA
jgi:hypothetical protein